MSSKVVHLSNEAHAKAKTFCKANGLKMSDWVASLIELAVANGGQLSRPMAPPPPPPAPEPVIIRQPVPQPVPTRAVSATRPVVASSRPVSEVRGRDGRIRAAVKKKSITNFEDRPASASEADDSAAPWESPPFWSNKPSEEPSEVE